MSQSPALVQPVVQHIGAGPPLPQQEVPGVHISGVVVLFLQHSEPADMQVLPQQREPAEQHSPPQHREPAVHCIVPHCNPDRLMMSLVLLVTVALLHHRRAAATSNVPKTVRPAQRKAGRRLLPSGCRKVSSLDSSSSLVAICRAGW
eukprot:CAMPEP_0197627210 /NCGR_PEP_ID=MMETSP1338-20131121/5884_1 /TAXON_ID=43686 ORGANISM="Pelagodinium beii, Strain RCC1491" /NCGR_SAMPLE_ID=MMETSP1338 /ASSEMBLY_ACC=CAM_ASM_000754 /LENGTH=146 /DNA_ID=CAMNT_0043197865 /DNA_START=266 /DNA_END=706 /DNA_ORIENTATION=+